MTNSSRFVGTIVAGLGTVCLGTCTATSNTVVSTPSGYSETDIAADLDRMADQFLNVQELDPFVYDLTEDEAYRWQAEFVAALQPNLGRIAGYKTGGHDTLDHRTPTFRRTASVACYSRAWCILAVHRSR